MSTEETSNGDCEGDPVRVIPLLNGMVDVALVFGFDETCSKELGVMEDLDPNFDAISHQELKLHFLQIITPGQVYPERSSEHTKTSSTCELSNPPPQQDEAGTTSPPPGTDKKKFNIEDFGLSWEAIEPMHFFFFPEKNNGLSASSCKNTLSFSEGPHIYNNIEDLPPSVIPLLFTNIVGDRSFASVLRFTRPFFISKPSESRYYSLSPWSPLAPRPSSKSKLVYLPTCLVLVSKLPCFQFMKDALSGFHTSLMDNCEDRDFWDEVRDWSARVLLIPAPPPGSLAVEFQLPGFQSNLVVRPPRGGISLTSPSPEQYLDIRFNYPFMCLSVDSVLQVISALLTGQTVIFVSSLYPMLTYVIQSFLTYISPFVWRHGLVPILPQPLLEYLDAPVATILGIHSSLTIEPEFQRLEDAVVVDLDAGKVTVLLQEDSGPLPLLPKAAAENFKNKYSILQKQAYEVCAMQQLSPTSTSKQQKEREEFDHNLDDILSKLFLELMVRLYSKVMKQLLQGRILYEELVKSMDPEDQAFYRQTESTDMFTAFYQRQRQGMQNDFNLLALRLEKEERKQGNDLEESYRPRGSVINRSAPYRSTLHTSHVIPTGSAKLSFHTYHSFSGTSMSGSHSSGTRKISTGAVSSSIFHQSLAEGEDHRISPINALGCSLNLSASAELVQMELPALGSEFKGREDFLDEVIETLEELQKNSAVEAQCVYLHAYYLLCQKKLAQALDDFFGTLQRLEVNLVPQYKDLQSLLAFISKEDKASLEFNTHYKYLVSCRRKTFSNAATPIDLEKTMPKKPLNHNEFNKIVHRNAITTDAESASNLHAVLSLERTTIITPETFKTFYKAWKLVLQENETVDIPNVTLGKEEKGYRIAERVLAVSQAVRTNFGSQSILVLTTYRLLAVTGFSTHKMADFSVPIRFDMFNYAPIYIGAKNPGIRIELLESHKSDKKKTQDLFMAFQENLDRENWYHMLVEMQASWKQSQGLKDPSVMETAQCHVILLNAINQSGLLDSYNHVQRLKRVMKLLTYQSKDVSEVSPITVEALQYRINPSLHEPEKQTVESLLYIPPSDDDRAEGGQGKLWIGLGNGRLKVYDVESKCFESDIKITESKHGRSVRLSCLLLVNQHVWVGSFSKNIHILDAETVCYVSQLTYLEGAPRDMALSEDGTVVWSLLLNGVLLAWDPITRKGISKIKVPISDDSHYTTCTCFTIWRDQIWVGTNRGSISVMDTQTESRITELFFPGGTKRQVEIKQLAVSCEDEVWCSAYSIPRSEDSNSISVFNPHTLEKKMQYSKLDNRVSIILPVFNSMWCGTKSGKIYIFHARTYAQAEGMPKILSAHKDLIRTMTLTDMNLVVSGSGSNDGYAAVWKTIDLPD